MHALNIDTLIPTYRRLKGYAFDPSFSNQLASSSINTIVYPIRWEALEPGPIGEYLEVIDIDPASSVFYPPVDLNDPRLLAQDGLAPSESNPQFHQQMVYAVAMLTIQHFEKALGRRVQWSSKDYEEGEEEQFVPHLRLYPHAFRGANAYYSSQKKAVLFGYFSARPSDHSLLMPGSLVFSCLSHDIIAHEITHALIDGIHKRYVYPIHEDTLAVHEAFSDIVALFQHFTFPEILENQIARTRGNLSGNNWLSQLAQQFGLAIGRYNSLRNAISLSSDGKLITPDPLALASVKEPHERGSILVAAMFHAFLSVYNNSTSDLFRIATEGRGVLPEGEIHPDLVRQLANRAARIARQFLSLFIRALDYCPPVGTSFGELLRAMITADVDLIATDSLNYRVALIESFKRWGIYPEGIYTLSIQTLTHNSYTEDDLKELGVALLPRSHTPSMGSSPNPDIQGIDTAIQELRNFLRAYYNETALALESRQKLFELSLNHKKLLHEAIKQVPVAGRRLLQNLTGILLVPEDYDDFERDSLPAINRALEMRMLGDHDELKVTKLQIKCGGQDQLPSFEIHSLNRAQRVGPEANVLNQVIVTIMQRCYVTVHLGGEHGILEEYVFRGGSTMVVDIDKKTTKFMHKGILAHFHLEVDATRLANELVRRYHHEVTEGESPFAIANWPMDVSLAEPFAMLHRHP
jgi:hypothetical protein